MSEEFDKRYGFISYLLIIFSVTVLLMSVIGNLIGEGLENMSSLFRLGSNGIAYSTLIQLLFLSFLITCLRTFFCSDRIFKNMMTLWRTIFILLSTFIVTIVFVVVFGWFPVNSQRAWIYFLFSYGGCVIGVSAFIFIKNKLENIKYSRLLSEYKDKDDNEKHG